VTRDRSRLAGMALAALLLATAGPLRAMDDVVEIAAARPGVFHHLDASGRNSLALAGDAVALVWEDNRSGAPGCYLALQSDAAAGFREFGFGEGECYEPAIAAYDSHRFLLIWEDAAGVNVALADANGPGPATRLAAAGGQGSLAVHARLGALAAWSAPDGRWRRIWLAPLKLDGNTLVAAAPQPADATPAADDQTYPVLAAAAEGLALVWEDRRHGHTVILGSHSADAQTWSPPVRVSGNPTGKQAGDLGRGSGAMRPALAVFGQRIAAVWLDKRDFLSGYDVYAALTEPGSLRFARDAKAQDSFGDAIAQWHATAAGNSRGDLVIAWDDDRDGTTDIWLTRLGDAGYSDNFTLPALSGPGRQSDPALALDAAGNLHLAWIERDASEQTRLRYTRLPAR
jgi:hypothetical protein